MHAFLLCKLEFLGGGRIYGRIYGRKAEIMAKSMVITNLGKRY